MIFRSTDNPVNGFQLPITEFVAASVKGERKGKTQCEDAWSCESLGDICVVVVCDGAGSASHAKEGAVIASGIATKYLKRYIQSNKITDFSDIDTWENIIQQTISHARSVVKRIIKYNDSTIHNYHATLIGTIFSKKGGIFFHIGDGAAIACADTENWDKCIVSPPKNGLYINQTYFYTENNWEAQLRLTPFGPSKLITLFSDGVEYCLLDEDGKSINVPFATVIDQHFVNCNPDQCAIDLADTLQQDLNILKSSDDDKTILWMKLTGGEQNELLPRMAQRK